MNLKKKILFISIVLIISSTGAIFTFHIELPFLSNYFKYPVNFLLGIFSGFSAVLVIYNLNQFRKNSKVSG